MNTITTNSSQQLARLNLDILILRFFGKLAKGDTSLIERSGTGICDNLSRFLGKHDIWLNPPCLNSVIRAWPKFSGDLDHPIKPPATFKGSASDYYRTSYKWGGDQLDARRDLAKHVLANISMLIIGALDK